MKVTKLLLNIGLLLLAEHLPWLDPQMVELIMLVLDLAEDKNRK